MSGHHAESAGAEVTPDSPSEDGGRSATGRPGLWSREVDVSFLWRYPRAHPAGMIMALGVILRLLAYLQNRDYWLDEGTLLGNILGKAPFEFSGHLEGDQLAPFGFLVVERILVGWFGISGLVTRFVPLACGLGAIWLFRTLVDRWLTFPAALVALMFFAFSDDLIYYASELKPYSSDLAVSLAVLVLADRLRFQPFAPRPIAGLGLLLVAAPWVSFPSAFAIAGVGLALVLSRLARRRWRELAWLAGLAAAWLISFAAAYRASHALLAPATSMYVFWNFAFLAPSPRDAAAWWTFGRSLLEIFVNPLNLMPPRLPDWWVIVPLGLIGWGALTLARRDRTATLMLLFPVALAVAASAARRYPFHGRLILGLLPACYMLLAEGIDRIRVRFGRRAFLAVAILLLAHPVWTTLYENSGPRMRDFNSHGDLRRNRFVP